MLLQATALGLASGGKSCPTCVTYAAKAATATVAVMAILFGILLVHRVWQCAAHGASFTDAADADSELTSDKASDALDARRREAMRQIQREAQNAGIRQSYRRAEALQRQYQEVAGAAGPAIAQGAWAGQHVVDVNRSLTADVRTLRDAHRRELRKLARAGAPTPTKTALTARTLRMLVNVQESAEANGAFEAAEAAQRQIRRLGGSDRTNAQQRTAAVGPVQHAPNTRPTHAQYRRMHWFCSSSRAELRR